MLAGKKAAAARHDGGDAAGTETPAASTAAAHRRLLMSPPAGGQRSAAGGNTVTIVVPLHGKDVCLTFQAGLVTKEGILCAMQSQGTPLPKALRPACLVANDGAGTAGSHTSANADADADAHPVVVVVALPAYVEGKSPSSSYRVLFENQPGPSAAAVAASTLRTVPWRRLHLIATRRVAITVCGLFLLLAATRTMYQGAVWATGMKTRGRITATALCRSGERTTSMAAASTGTATSSGAVGKGGVGDIAGDTPSHLALKDTRLQLARNLAEAEAISARISGVLQVARLFEEPQQFDSNGWFVPRDTEWAAMEQLCQGVDTLNAELRARASDVAGHSPAFKRLAQFADQHSAEMQSALMARDKATLASLTGAWWAVFGGTFHASVVNVSAVAHELRHALDGIATRVAELEDHERSLVHLVESSRIARTSLSQHYARLRWYLDSAPLSTWVLGTALPAIPLVGTPVARALAQTADIACLEAAIQGGGGSDHGADYGAITTPAACLARGGAAPASWLSRAVHAVHCLLASPVLCVLAHLAVAATAWSLARLTRASLGGTVQGIVCDSIKAAQGIVYFSIDAVAAIATAKAAGVVVVPLLFRVVLPVLEGALNLASVVLGPTLTSVAVAGVVLGAFVSSHQLVSMLVTALPQALLFALNMLTSRRGHIAWGVVAVGVFVAALNTPSHQSHLPTSVGQFASLLDTMLPVLEQH